jgi:hypothetical protein
MKDRETTSSGAKARFLLGLMLELKPRPPLPPFRRSLRVVCKEREIPHFADSVRSDDLEFFKKLLAALGGLPFRFRWPYGGALFRGCGGGGGWRRERGLSEIEAIAHVVGSGVARV